MDNLYGLPVIGDQEALSIVPAWSLQLARVLAARVAAFVAATGAVPEGDPDTVAGMVARLGALEELLNDVQPSPWVDLPLTSPWVPYSTDGAYYPGMRARGTAAGVQIQGMVKGGGQNTEICVIPAHLKPEFGGHFASISNSQPATVFISGTGQLRYLSGGASTAYVSVNLLVPLP